MHKYGCLDLILSRELLINSWCLTGSELRGGNRIRKGQLEDLRRFSVTPAISEYLNNKWLSHSLLFLFSFVFLFALLPVVEVYVWSILIVLFFKGGSTFKGSIYM